MEHYPAAPAGTGSLPAPFPTSSDAPSQLGTFQPGSLDTGLAQTRRLRSDGWTPERKRDFLERLATSGVVADACFHVGISARSAYNLRNRDRLFATGWDAACVMARQRLADELYSRAVHGQVVKLVRDGEVVAERMYHDNRLAMAVLTRLDTRIASGLAGAHGTGAVVTQWDAYLDAIATGRIAAGEAILTDQSHPAQTYRELHELRSRSDDERDPHNIWVEGDVAWTSYPPPAGFVGHQEGSYGDRCYRRTLTAEEEAQAITYGGPDLAEAERMRDKHFARLARRTSKGRRTS